MCYVYNTLEARMSPYVSELRRSEAELLCACDAARARLSPDASRFSLFSILSFKNTKKIHTSILSLKNTSLHSFVYLRFAASFEEKWGLLFGRLVIRFFDRVTRHLGCLFRHLLPFFLFLLFLLVQLQKAGGNPQLLLVIINEIRRMVCRKKPTLVCDEIIIKISGCSLRFATSVAVSFCYKNKIVPHYTF